MFELVRGTRYVHANMDGTVRRRCTFTDHGDWWYWVEGHNSGHPADNRMKCWSMHPSSPIAGDWIEPANSKERFFNPDMVDTREDFTPASDADELPCVCITLRRYSESCPRHGERGEFGMPGVGMAGTVVSQFPVRSDEGRMPEEMVKLDAYMPRNGWRCRIAETGVSVDYGEKGHAAEATTDDARYILKVVPEILIHFLEKNTQYARAQTGHDLGVKGIIPDINRKTAALITQFWDNDGEITVDAPEELIGDLIGHLLLMLAKLRDE